MILAFASILRFYRLDYDLPNVFDPDEPYIMDRVVEVADGNLAHGIILRGSIPYYVNGFAIKLMTIFKPSSVKDQNTISEAYKIDKTPFYITARSISALYGVLEIVFLFLLAKLVSNTKTALVASLILSLSSLTINYSHRVTPDTALSTFILITLYLTLKAYQSNKLALYYLSSFFVGLSAAQKLPGIYGFPILVFAFIRSKLVFQMKLNYKIKTVFYFIAISFFAYFLSYPFIFQNFNQIIDQWLSETEQTWWYGRVQIPNLGLFGRMNEYLVFLKGGTGTFVSTLGVIGIIWSIGISTFTIMMLALFFFIFLLGISLPIPYYDRWAIPLIPVISFFTASFALHIIPKLKNKLQSFILNYLSLSLILVAPLIKSTAMSLSFNGLDTRTQEIQWLHTKNIDESGVLRDQLTGKSQGNTIVYMTDLNRDQLERYHYFITSSYYYSKFFENPDVNAEKAKIYEKIFNSYYKVQEFKPSKMYLYYDDFEYLLNPKIWKFYQTRGPLITIFDLTKSKSPVSY